mgnify:CR=1 FL=1
MRPSRRLGFGLFLAALTLAVPIGAAGVTPRASTSAAAHHHTLRRSGLHAPPANVTPPSMAHTHPPPPSATPAH